MAEMIKSMTALLLLLSGCATPGLESSLPLKRPLGRSYATFVPPLAADENTPTPLDPTDIGGELTLDEAAALALLHNPELQVFAWSVRAAEARRLQAGLRPNPELDIETENVALLAYHVRTSITSRCASCVVLAPNVSAKICGTMLAAFTSCPVYPVSAGARSRHTS